MRPKIRFYSPAKIMNFKFLKTIVRKFLPLAKLKPEILEYCKKLDLSLFAERTFYFGKKKQRAWCLQMESAPGTSEIVIKLLRELNPQGKILDFGCGQHQSRYLQNLGFNVHSCDIFPFDFPNYTRIDPDVKQLPFEDQTFDIVIASEVLEHVESPWELLREIKRITKQFIITTPNPVSLKSKKIFEHTGYFYWFEPKNFSYHITPIFFWQIKLFCKRQKIRLSEMHGNHEAFDLSDQGRMLDYAEALIYKIDI